MKNFISFFIRRPVATFMLFIAVVSIGVISFLRLSIDLLPQIEFPSISIMTTYEGVNPHEMETLITRPIEEAVSTIQGVERVESFSAEGRSRVQLRFSWGTSLDSALSDVRAAVERVKGVLPEDADTPVVFKFDLSTFPIMMLTLSGEMEPWRLRKLADEDLKYRLERVNGVAAVDVRGGLRREIQVNLSALKLTSYGITPSQVIAALKRDNIDVAAGDVLDREREVIVRTVGEFKSVNQIAETVVGVKDRQPIKVKDLGFVSDSFEKPTSSVFFNRKPGIRLAVSKLPDANTVDVSQRVEREIEKINAQMPHIKIGKRFDSAEFIKDSISSLKQGLIIGAVLAVIILIIFLRRLYPTVIVSVAIPIAIIGTFAFMYLLGFTLNMITLGGLAIGLGMLVDNSIVVIENIQYHRNLGSGKKESSIQGASEVAIAITASTLTTVCVFIPVIFLGGLPKILFGQLAAVVTFSLICSLTVALTLVPVMASLGRENSRRRVLQELARKIEIYEGRILSGYSKTLYWVLKRRKWVYSLALFLFIASLFALKFVGKELMPETDQGEISITGELPVGTPLEKTEKVAKNISAMIENKVPEAELVMAMAGPPGFWSEAGSNGINIRVELKKKPVRKRSTEKIAGFLRPHILSIPDFKSHVRLNEGFFIFRMLRGGGERIGVEIRGYELSKSLSLAKRISGIIEKIDGVTDTDIDLKEGNEEASIFVDNNKAADLGLTPGDIARTVSTYVLGTVSTYYRERGDEFPIRVELNESDRRNRSQLEELPIVTPSGKHILLKDIATIKRTYAPLSIRRINQERVVTVSAGFAGRDLGSIIADIKERISKLPLPEGLSINMGGEYEEQQKTFSGLIFGFILAIMLIYMVMASLYESLKHPFIILFSIPFAFIGVVAILLLTGTTLNVYSFIGVIVLVGVVVNNAIVMIDYINLLRRERGVGLVEAVVEGATRRLRPILMTTLTTVLALIPVAIGIGEGSEMQTPLSRVLVGGLTSSTLITLVLIPCIYVSFEKSGKST